MQPFRPALQDRQIFFTPFDRYVLRPAWFPSTGAAPRWLPDRHQDWTMHAHDCPRIETPDFLLAVLERANDGVVIVDSDLHVSHFNAAAELLWQMDRAEVLGHHVSRLGLKDLELQHVATATPGQLNGSDATQRCGPEIRIQRK